MRKVTVFHGVIAGFLISFSCAALFAVMAPLLGSGLVLRALVAVAAMAYLGWLLNCRKSRAGGVSAFVFWLAAAGVLWFSGPSLTVYIAAHVGLIWLLRSFCFHRGLVAALADLGLSGLALSAATWAAVETHSVALSFWTFFLVQSLFVAIPATVKRIRRPADERENHRFQRAQRTAESALRRLYSNQ